MFRNLKIIVKLKTTTNSRFISKSSLNCCVELQVKVKLHRKAVQLELEKLLGVRPLKALEIIATCQKFSKSSSTLLSHNYDICRNNKVRKETILSNPCLLAEANLSKKIEKLKVIPMDLNSSVHFSRLTMQRISFLVINYDEIISRIEDLCNIFMITENDCCKILATKEFLLTKSLEHIKNNLGLFHGFGISKEDVLKDLWILKYSNAFLKNRLKLIREHKIEDVKTWMLRCPEVTLFKYIKRETDNKVILGENSVLQYLSGKLKCNDTIAKYVIGKHPQLQNKSILKLEEMIDFLYKHGFTPDHICRVPKILLHSTKTTEKRLKELTALGKKIDSLYVLTKSQKQYLQHIDNLLK